jgi:hypothetical protein
LPQTKIARIYTGKKLVEGNIASGRISSLGKAQGKKNVESGTLALALHRRHHVIAGKKPKKSCLFCKLGEKQALQRLRVFKGAQEG